MANPPPLQVQCVSTEEENGFRLQLLIQKATEVLRNKFHQHFSNDPSTLYQELSVHQRLLKRYLLQKTIYKNQYSLLFPANSLRNSGSFDICLLTFLLRSLCGLPAPATGWSAVPLPTDKTESAHLVRIRIGRNKVQHGALKWDLTDFTEVWDEISDPLIGLGCTKSELNDLKTRPLDSIAVQNKEQCMVDLKAAVEKVAHLEDCCLNGLNYDIFPPIPSFIGRENDIQKIHENLINMDDGKIALVVSGFGGVGKSELVRRYCQEFGATFYKNNTIWINAKSVSSVADAFNNVAELIKLDVKEPNGQFLDLKVVITKVFRFFAGRNVLFVFDNVVNEANVSDYLSLYVQPGVQKPYVIITSQNVQWGQRYIAKNINVFTPVVAEAFVYRTLKNNSLNSENNEKLCELLEYLPLALQQTVSYIQKTGITVDNYLKEFKSHKQLLLSEGHYDTRYSKTVMTTWNMAIEKIKETNNPLALRLITIMSYLDGKNINKMLFLELCDNDIIALNKSINILEQYSIINVSESNDYTKETITIHSLVQFVVLIDEQVCNNEPEKLMLSFLRTILQKSQYVSKENLSFENLWINHVIFIIHSHENKDIILMFIEYVHILYDVLKRKGKLSQLQESIQTLANFLSKTSNSNEDNFKISIYLTMCLQDQGKLNEALEIYYDVEKKVLTLFGPNHGSVLTTKHNIASCKQGQGKLNEALEIYYEVENKLLTSLGPNHGIVLTTQHNIASCLKDQGKLNEALEIYYDVENKRLTLVGPNHDSVLTTQNSIALCLKDKGKLNEALEIFYDVEKKRLTLFGPNHESVLTTQHNIAFCKQSQGKLNEALEIYIDVENKRLTLFGPNHESVLATQNNIGMCLKAQGKLIEALEIYYDVQKKGSILFGPNHESVLTTQNNIASCKQGQGKLNEALEIYHDIEKKGLTLFGPNHESVLTTQHNIASCLQDQGKLNGALEIFYDVEKKRLTLFGPNHESVHTTQNNIALCKQGQGKLNEALEIYHDIEKKGLTLFGPSHESVLTTQHNIASCLQDQGKLNGALEIYIDVEKKRLTLFGPNHQSVLTTQNNIASCKQGQGKLNEALEIYYDVEKKRLTLLGPNHESVLTTQNNIASCLQDQGKLNEALEIFDDIEKKRFTLYGPNHPSVINTRACIAYCKDFQSVESFEIFIKN